MAKNPRSTINRQLILVLPKQPALDWLMSVDPQPLDHLTLNDIRQETEAFLIPEGIVNSPEQAQSWAERRWSELFLQFVSGWYLDMDLWPKKRTLKMFREWFDVQYHSMVWDLADEPLTHEEWDD